MHKNVVISWSIEFGPIILFFLSMSILGSEDRGFLISTAIFTITMIIALFSSFKYEKRIAWFPLIAGTSVISFGLLTLFFQKPIIFILKDTFYNGFFAILLLIGAIYKKALLKPLFKALFDMSDIGWYKLSVRWGVFFLILAIGNELVWRLFDQNIWVKYKFWSTIATTIFGLYQIKLSKKYRNERATKWGMRIDPFHITKI